MYQRGQLGRAVALVSEAMEQRPLEKRESLKIHKSKENHVINKSL